MPTIAVALPSHLRTLAGIDGDIAVEVADPVTIAGVLDSLEAQHPVLRGTIRDHGTHRRRAFMRYFACEEDLSLESPDTQLPPAVVGGKDVFRVVTAIAGG